VRLNRVVARAVLIAALASVVVPGLVGSRIPSAPTVIDPSAFQTVGFGQSVAMMTISLFDPENQSAGHLDATEAFGEPQPVQVGSAAPRPLGDLTTVKPLIKVIWRYDPNISWYGPGFWGQHTACGQILEANTIGVAHRTLPCGTRVTFTYNGRTVVARVIDRGPYVSGRIWDLTKATCTVIGHCWSGGGVYYRIG
jgi:Lipoproteins